MYLCTNLVNGGARMLEFIKKNKYGAIISCLTSKSPCPPCRTVACSWCSFFQLYVATSALNDPQAESGSTEQKHYHHQLHSSWSGCPTKGRETAEYHKQEQQLDWPSYSNQTE